MSLPARFLAAFLACVVAFAAGWGAAIRYRNGVEAKAQIAQSESSREAERLSARNVARITDDLSSKRIAAVRSAADLRGRLREQSEAGSSSAAIAACRNDAASTAARVVPERVGSDLVALMERAEEVSAQLAACQAVLSVAR